MKVFVENTYIDFNLKDALVFGKVIDQRVVNLENRVAAHYSVSRLILTDWRQDSDVKKTLCFVLYSQLNYSIGSLAARYNINKLYLKNYLTKTMAACLRDVDVMSFYQSFNTNLPLINSSRSIAS